MVEEGMLNAPGDLTYVVYRLLKKMWEKAERKIAARNPFDRDYYSQFAVWAGLRGAVDEAVSEFRRRTVTPYEKRKLAENGDVD